MHLQQTSEGGYILLRLQMKNAKEWGVKTSWVPLKCLVVFPCFLFLPNSVHSPASNLPIKQCKTTSEGLHLWNPTTWRQERNRRNNTAVSEQGPLCPLARSSVIITVLWGQPRRRTAPMCSFCPCRHNFLSPWRICWVVWRNLLFRI